MSLSQPLNINGVKLNEDEAQAVVSGLANDNEGNQIKRYGYGRYFLTLISVLPMPLDMTNTELFSGKIDRITFYEDDTYQKPFWSGVSSVADYHNNSEYQELIPFKGVDTPTAQ